MRHQLPSHGLSRRVLCVVSPKGDVVCPAFARATASVTLVPVGVRPGSRTIRRPHLRNSLIPGRRADLAARLRAFLGAADVHVPLTLALVLSLAGIARSRAASLTFARVYARAVHLRAGLVLGPRQDVSSKYQTRRGARDQHPSFARAHSYPSSGLVGSQAARGDSFRAAFGYNRLGGPVRHPRACSRRSGEPSVQQGRKRGRLFDGRHVPAIRHDAELGARDVRGRVLRRARDRDCRTRARVSSRARSHGPSSPG